MRPSLGDFLAAAGGHIDAATGREVPAEAAHAVVHQLSRITSVMTRFADAITAHDETESLHLLDGQARAVLDARIALRQSAARMRTAAGVLGNSGNSQEDPCAERLAAAADCLAAGHDLLQTHFRPGPFGSRLGTSPWAPILVSEAASTALAVEMTGYARRLAPWALQLSLAFPEGPALPARARAHVSAACRSLRVAEAAAWTLSCDGTPTATQSLLHAIPVNAVPLRCTPLEGEEVPGLCTGAVATAERLRHLAHLAATRPAMPHAGLAISWQRTAQGAAITGHCSELILRQLAELVPGSLFRPSAEVALRQATNAISHTWAAWRNVAHQWDTFTTGRSVMLTPVAAEIGDLVLWVGRLAHTDPAWTPARSDTSPLRTATTMAEGPGSITGVVTALHEVSDAFAHIATGDRDAVQAADAHGGLFVPTRLLPSTYDVPYRYAPSLPSMTAALLGTYDEAISAGTHAATALGNLATVIGARPTVHAALHATSGQDMPHLLHAAVPLGRIPQQPAPGQVEQALRKIGISEPTLLAQAADLDDATQNLITAASAVSQRQITAYRATLHAVQEATAADAHPAGLAVQAASATTTDAAPLPGTSAPPHRPGKHPGSHF